MNLSVNCGVGAIFKCVVRKADTHEIVKETPEFHNLVLDSGLARMSVGAWIDRCVVGSGNSEPTATQVSLDNMVASTTTVATGVSDTAGIQVTTAPFYWFGCRTWRFATGTATGNLSEIGLGWDGSSLWNRALIRDNLGNPTTITVLADEYLDVFCEVRVYPSDSSGSFNVVDKLSNIISTHNYLAKSVMGVTGSVGAGWKASIVKPQTTAINYGLLIRSDDIVNDNTTTPSATGSLKTATPTSAYNGANLNCSTTITSSEGNGSHRSFYLGIDGLMCLATTNATMGRCGFKWQIDPPITKTNAMILTYSFSVSWGRYEPA